MKVSLYIPCFNAQATIQRCLKAVFKQKHPFIGVQYSLYSIEPLKRIFDGQDGVIFIDNEKVFKDALKTVPYREYFTDYIRRPLRTLYQERQPPLGREYRQCDIEGLFLPSPI